MSMARAEHSLHTPIQKPYGVIEILGRFTISTCGSMNDRHNIIQSTKPGQAAKLAKRIEATLQWKQQRDEAMSNTLKCILEHSESAKTEMRENRAKNFVYLDAYDRYWGCGMSEEVARVMDMKKYPGENRIGQIYTEISREEV